MVSIWRAPWPASTRRPTPRADRSCTVLTEMGEVSAEAVELPDDEHVALPQGAQADCQDPAGRRGRRRRSRGRRLTASTPAAYRASRCRSNNWEPSVFETRVVADLGTVPFPPGGDPLDGGRSARLGHDALDLVDRHRVRRPVVELRRLGRRVSSDLLGVLQRPLRSRGTP